MHSFRNVAEMENMSLSVGNKNNTVFGRRWDSVSRENAGHNLVMKRKSLNVETQKRFDTRVKADNLRFLQKL